MAEQIKVLMSAAEFEALEERDTPTELIEGELVVRGTPYIIHQRISRNLLKVLFNLNLDGELFHPPTSVKFNDANYYQPDLIYVAPNNPNCTINIDGIDGAPDLVVEIISHGTAKTDRGIKFETYQTHGVAEYWIVEPEEAFLQVWQLQNSHYVLVGTYEAGEQFTSPTLDKAILLEDIFPQE